MNSNRTVLIADDEADIIELLEYNLKNEGYQVLSAENGREALDIIEKKKPDLIILDVMMPNMSGHEVAEALRNNAETKDIPFIFLTARSEEESEIQGLNLGADDYIHKPIKPKILISRINSIFRRIEPNKEGRIELGDLMIDKTSHKVKVKGEKIKLAKKEFKLLYLLANQPGRVFERDEIMNKVWGNDVIVGDRTIDVHIRKIRAKLGINCIETIKGVGYMFDLSGE